MAVSGLGSGLSIAKEFRTVSAATWAADEITLTTGSAHGLAVGAQFRVVNIAGSTSTYNGDYVAVTGTTGSTIVAARSDDPGTSTIVSSGDPSTHSGVYSIGMTTTPSRRVQILNESLGYDVANIETPSLKGGSVLPQVTARRAGRQKVQGDTNGILYNHGETLLWEGMLGAIVRTGSDPYTHTASLGERLPSFTGQVSIGGTATTMVKQMVGMMVDSWQLALVAGEIATLGITWVGTGMTLTTGASLPGSDPTALHPYAYMDGTITVNGATPGCVKRITVGGNNNLDSDSLCIGRTRISDPERNGFAEITGEIEFEIDTSDTSLWDDYVAGTQRTVTLVLTRVIGADTFSVTITMKVVWTADPTPRVTGPEKITITAPYEVYLADGDEDDDSFSVAILNKDATP